MSNTASRLRQLREERDEKQATVAQALGISRATLSTYENGLTPSIDNAIALAKHFGVSLDYILGLSTERNTGTSSLATQFIAMRQLSEESAPTAADLTALVDAALIYLSNGSPCGTGPMTAWRDFMRNLAACLSSASAGNVAQVIDRANAAVIAALEVTKMPAAMLEKKGVTKK